MSRATQSIARSDRILYDAVNSGNLALVRERIAVGANVNAGTKERYPPLFMAAMAGHFEIVCELIAAGADVNQLAQIRRETYPTCPLVLAVKNGHFEVAQELVRFGAKMGLETYNGNNAATEAAFMVLKRGWHARNSGGWLAKIANLGSQSDNRNAEERWMQFVRDALKQKAPIRDYCLWEATKLKHEELAFLLIEHGVNPNASPHNSTALSMAITNELTNIAVALLKAGADPNKVEGFSAAPLLLAAARGNYEVVKALLDAGANINVTGDVMAEKSDIPSFKKDGDNSIVMNLSEILSDPKLAQGSTALVIAVRRGDHKITKLLLEHGADSKLGDKRGRIPLAWAIDLGWHQITETLRGFHSPEPKFLEGSEAAALLSAAENGDENETRLLLSDGANANTPVDDIQGRRFPIHAAAENGHVKIVRLLLDAGADVNTARRVEFTVGVTALMLAAEASHLNVVNELLNAGADVHAKTKEIEGGNETALHYAARGGSADVICLLVKSGAKVEAKAKGQVTPLMNAVSARRLEAAQTLISLGADVNTSPNDGTGPLLLATLESDVPMTKLLLSKGANTLPLAKRLICLPLESAASEGSIELVRMLLEAGAPINAVSFGGSSALASATTFGHTKIVEILLDAGADPNLTDTEGRTPIMIAVRLGNEQIFNLLLSAGADINRKNNTGETCLDIALVNNNDLILRCIKNAGGKDGNEVT
jgi:ankyrin repeat protein